MGLHLPVGLDLLNLRMAPHSTTTRKLRLQGEMLKVPLRRAERTCRTKTSFSAGPEVCPFSGPSYPKEVAWELPLAKDVSRRFGSHRHWCINPIKDKLGSCRVALPDALR